MLFRRTPRRRRNRIHGGQVNEPRRRHQGRTDCRPFPRQEPVRRHELRARSGLEPPNQRHRRIPQLQRERLPDRRKGQVHGRIPVQHGRSELRDKQGLQGRRQTRRLVRGGQRHGRHILLLSETSTGIQNLIGFPLRRQFDIRRRDYQVRQAQNPRIRREIHEHGRSGIIRRIDGARP